MMQAKQEKLEIAAVGDENFVTGFQIAGIREAIIVGSDANRTFEEAMARPDIGIIITDSSVFGRLSARMQEKAMTVLKPTVVVLSHDVSGESNMRLMIKRALGMDVWGNSKE